MPFFSKKSMLLILCVLLSVFFIPETDCRPFYGNKSVFMYKSIL